jgi:hypothetical protein
MGFSDILQFLPGPVGPIMKFVEGVLPSLTGGVDRLRSMSNKNPLAAIPQEALNRVTGAPLTSPSSALQHFMSQATQDTSIHLD